MNSMPDKFERHYNYTIFVEDCYVYSYSPAEMRAFKEHATLYQIEHKIRHHKSIVGVTDNIGRYKRSLGQLEGYAGAVTVGKYKMFWLRENDNKKAKAVIDQIIVDLTREREAEIQHLEDRIHEYEVWRSNPEFISK